jgi:hypothetical protein
MFGIKLVSDDQLDGWFIKLARFADETLGSLLERKTAPDLFKKILVW